VSGYPHEDGLYVSASPGDPPLRYGGQVHLGDRARLDPPLHIGVGRTLEYRRGGRLRALWVGDVDGIARTQEEIRRRGPRGVP
jgi:hypothetical protein